MRPSQTYGEDHWLRSGCQDISVQLWPLPHGGQDPQIGVGPREGNRTGGPEEDLRNLWAQVAIPGDSGLNAATNMGAPLT